MRRPWRKAVRPPRTRGATTKSWDDLPADAWALRGLLVQRRGRAGGGRQTTRDEPDAAEAGRGERFRASIGSRGTATRPPRGTCPPAAATESGAAPDGTPLPVHGARGERSPRRAAPRRGTGRPPRRSATARTARCYCGDDLQRQETTRTGLSQAPGRGAGRGEEFWAAIRGRGTAARTSHRRPVAAASG